jgi:hypothetical protein
MGTIMYPTKSSPQINKIIKYPNNEIRHTVIPLKCENKSTFLSKTTDCRRLLLYCKGPRLFALVLLITAAR